MVKKTRGRNQLRDLIEDLCDSEECQQFISWKLCRHFICDDPEPEMISIVTDAWKKSNGMLPEIHQAPERYPVNIERGQDEVSLKKRRLAESGEAGWAVKNGIIKL